MKDQNKILLYEVRYTTFDMDRPTASYFYYKENAQKFYEEISSNDNYGVDRPRAVPVDMEFVCYTRPDAIEDADEKVDQILMRYMLRKRRGRYID